MSMSVSLSFHNFWPDFDINHNFFTQALREKTAISVVPAGQDIQIFSVFGSKMPPKTAGRPLRVWFTGEARMPVAHRLYDLQFGFQHNHLLGSRSIRFPLWIIYIDWWNTSSPVHPSKLLALRQYEERARFCNFIFSSPASLRAEFCLRLSRYKPVDGLGAVLNTTGSRVADKLKAMREYRFAIAFENDLAHGYVTEKPFEALAAGCIPIYWGAREALADFNPDALIFAPDFESLDALVHYVASVDQSPELQRKFLTVPIFPDNKIPYEHTPQFFADCVLGALSGSLRDEIPDEWDGRLQKILSPKKRRIVKSWDPRRAPWIKRLRGR
jgi:hypothetical protein